MNKSDFLKDDLSEVIKHYECCLTCLANAETFLNVGNLEMAEKRIIYFEKSLDELNKLKQKKERQDQLKEVVRKLVSQGILVDLVSFRRRT